MKGKQMLVSLKISGEKLRDFPTDFQIKTEPGSHTPGPKSKATKAKKTLSITASPAPESPRTMEGTPVPTGKSGLSKVVNAEDFKLDKSGKPVRRWVKKTVDIQSFTGYYMQFGSYSGGPREESDGDVKLKSEDGKDDGVSNGTVKIHIKLNNKTLDLKDDESVADDSREQSPLVDDAASSIVSTPEISRVSTPAV